MSYAQEMHGINPVHQVSGARKCLVTQQMIIAMQAEARSQGMTWQKPARQD